MKFFYLNILIHSDLLRAMPEHMQSYTHNQYFPILTQGEMIQIVTITLILIYLNI